MMTEATIDRDNRETALPAKRSFFVLGGTGGTGSAVVEQALARGHRVCAFGRSVSRITNRERLSLREGDPHDTKALALALRGADVVISALGRRDKSDPLLLTDCTRATIDAMQAAKVSRVIVVSSALLFPDVGLLGSFLGRFVFSEAIADSATMEAYVDSSALDWTIVRPPRLLDRSASGKFRVRQDHLPPRGSSIPRADLAAFLVDEAERAAHVRQIVGVAS